MRRAEAVYRATMRERGAAYPRKASWRKETRRGATEVTAIFAGPIVPRMVPRNSLPKYWAQTRLFKGAVAAIKVPSTTA
jgi:hypothetical protein